MEGLNERVGVASLNVNGLANPIKRNNVFKHFKSTNIDIICLQETHVEHGLSPQIASEWQLPTHWNPGTNNSCGVGILLNSHKNFRVLQTLQDSMGRVLTLKISYHDITFQVCTIYAPTTPTVREHFFSTLSAYLFPQLPLILTGDFNMVEDPLLDRQGPTVLPQHTAGLRALTALKGQFKLTDSWRAHNPTQRKYTWPTKHREVRSRLDRIYLSDGLAHPPIQQSFHPTVWSDHKYVTTHLYMTKREPRGPNYWKLNTEVLAEPEYHDHLTQIIQQHKQKLPHYADILQWWDSLKHRIKHATILYCKRRAQARRTTMHNTTQHIDYETSLPRPDTARVEDLYRTLHDLQQAKERGTLIRSREKTLLNNERPTKYFFTQEQNRQERKNIRKLNAPDSDGPPTPGQGEYLTDSGEILSEIHRYYTELYTLRPPSLQAQRQMLSKLHVQIPATDAAQIDSPIQTTELATTLAQMDLNKTPGIDGLPAEFYTAFWEELKHDITLVAHHIYTNQQQCSHTQKRAIVALQHKDGERESLDNWRPISLLCVDYKLITKTLANRLRTSLHHILHADQTCTVPTRSLYDNLHLIREIITHTHSRATGTYLVSMDIKKAFDSVNHEFLLQTLAKLGYGPVFRRFVTNSYQNITANIMNNGYMTLNVHLQRGLRQGCPLSLLLYCIIAETLATEIRSNKRIRGYPVPSTNTPAKITQYADDTVLITQDVDSIRHTLEAFHLYSLASGCNLKQSKLKGLIIGRPTGSIDTLPGIQWVNATGLTVLGVTFFDDDLYTINHNWRTVLNKLAAKLAKLRYRSLSLRGKAIILNTLALSKVWFIAGFLHMPAWALKALEKQIFAFLWDDKKMEPIKRKTLYLPTNLGGLGILHPLLQHRALTLKYFFYITDIARQTTWLQFARYWMALRLYKYDSNWSFLKTNNTPKYNGTDPPLYYTRLEVVFQQHKDRLLQDPPHTTKQMYEILRLEHYRDHTILAQGLWDTTFHRPLPWVKLWGHTFLSHARGKSDDTLFRILHNSYPTGARMRNSRQRGNFNPNCGFCARTRNSTRLETTLHIFARCPFACKLWQAYQHIYTSLQPSIPFVYEEAALTLNLANNTTPKPIRLLLLTITNLILTEQWTARNKLKYERILPNHERSLRTINAHITSLLTTRHKLHSRNNTLTLFQETFLMNSALGHLQNTQLIITLPQ